MRTIPGASLRVFIALLAGVGLFGVLPVSWADFSSAQACPNLGSLPACHLVSAAYALVLLSVLHPRLWRPWLFLLAWLPIFALAFLGSGLELLGHGTCPQTAGGLPKCYLSLALASALLLPFLTHFYKTRRK